MAGLQVSIEVTRARRRAGLTQAALARRMATSQSVIARVETGRVSPTTGFLQKMADALGAPLVIEIRPRPVGVNREELRRRVKAATRGFVFNPWDRDPTPAEARSLDSDGLTREHFQRS